jgi:hypothetical protein
LKISSSDDDKGKLVHEFFNKDLKLKCKASGCVPSSYIELLKAGPDAVEGSRFMEVADNVVAAESMINPMVAKVGNENACRVFNWIIDGKMVAYNFCVVKGDDSMINGFNGLAMSLFD